MIFSKRKKFSKIYDQNIDKIYRFIFLKVSSEEVAQDLSSETFLKAWQAYNKKDSNIKNFSAFLYRIARNLIVDYYREKGRAQFVSTEAVPVIDPNSNIEEKAALNSDLEHIKLALNSLKDNYQNVIIWHYLDDLPMPKVAQMMEKTEENTRVILHRALKALKEEIGKRGTKES